MGDRENKQELSASATYKKKFILEEIEKMNEENIGLYMLSCWDGREKPIRISDYKK